MKLKTLLFLLLAMLTSTTLQAYDAEVDGIYYNFISDNEAEVTFKEGIIHREGEGDDAWEWIQVTNNDYSGSIVIPESITYDDKTYSVTLIGNMAFQNCNRLTSVTIGNNVRSIGEYVFGNCERLTSVTIGNSVTSINTRLFQDDDALNSIIVEEGNPVYDSRDNCNAIIETATNTLHTGCKTTIIPSSVTRIGGEAFYFCHGLKSVSIPNGVAEIGGYAFICCDHLTTVTIPESVTDIGYGAFSHCI